MLSFKAYLAQSLTATAQMAPFTRQKIMSVLSSSARAAALQCSGGDNGRMCGVSWVQGTDWDGSQGAGQQMAALEIVLGNLIEAVHAPVVSFSNGTSIANHTSPPQSHNNWTTSSLRERVGAAILTIWILSTMSVLFSWMIFNVNEAN
jgi:mannan endo-1,6-alpha-mannosidase